MLDEAQDCSPLQWMAFSKVVDGAQEVYLAGDDDQAIYEWSGADPHGMARFTSKHHGATMILSKSHRVPKTVHDMSEALIRQVGTRIDKVYTHRDGNPGTITRWGGIEDALFKLDEIAPEGALVLVRDRFKLEEIKRLLNQELVPYDVYGGVSPWTSKIARAIKRGELKMNEVPIMWREFYAQADLSLPIKYHLSTVHSAKGREHQTVIVDLSMPARVLLNVATDRDAELRVQYVSLTRSARDLHLCGENPLV
jgi:superfamily I DNA/RNA helicase